MKDLSFQIEKVHRKSHVNKNKPTPRYITEKAQNSGNKEISYKHVELGKKKDFQQRVRNYNSYKFHMATPEVRQWRRNSFKVLRGNYFQPRFSP